MNCSGAGRDPRPPDATIWHEPEMLRTLTDLDIGEVYRTLQRHGYTQYQIGWLTGQSQPEVFGIIHGRQVLSVQVLRRIARGLGIPPPLVGLACDRCPIAGSPLPASRPATGDEGGAARMASR